MSDWELLQQYLTDHAPDAMRQLIARHVDMVHATARRAAPSLADDITQAVFLILLRRAHSLSPRTILGGWLFKVTLYAAADARKQQQRRQRHEREAAAMRPTATTATPSANNTWDTIRPALNDALQHLPTSDRDLIVLRYLEGRPTADIARDLATPDGTIRQRLSRALQRLRARLARRGITTTDEALSAALLLAHTPGAAAALLSTLTALVAGAAPSTASLTLAQGALKLMAIAKTQLIALSAAAVLVLSAGAYVILTRNAPAVPAVAAGPTLTPTTLTTTPDALLAAQPAPQSASQPATQTGWPRTTPKTAILAAYHDAQTGDENGFLSSFNNLTDAQTADLRKIIIIFSTFHDLQQAATDRFGPEAAAQLGQMGTLGVSASDVEGATEQIDGANATVDFGNVGPGIIHLIKVGAIWKVDGANFGLPSAAMLAQAEQTLPAIKQLAADIRAGKYATLNDALQTMMKPAPR